MTFRVAWTSRDASGMQQQHMGHEMSRRDAEGMLRVLAAHGVRDAAIVSVDR